MNPATLTLRSADIHPGGVRVRTVVMCEDQPELRHAFRFTLEVTPEFPVITDAGDAHTDRDPTAPDRSTVKPEPRTLRSAEPSDNHGEFRVCTVVICDDQPELRDAIRFTLEATPRFSVVADACDAHSCIDQVRASQPDLLILDVNMPGGGPHVASAIKAMYPGVHIVVFSGRTDLAIQRAMLAAGADQYVLKTGRVQPLLLAMGTAYDQLTRSAAAGDPSEATDHTR